MEKYFNSFVKLGFKIEHGHDEEWEYSEEPHVSRRREILKKHPEIKNLMGYDTNIVLIVSAEVVCQLCMAYILRDANWTTIAICAYLISATLNHSLGSAIHEIGHNTAFGHGRPKWNRLLGIWCNLPMIVPISVTYKKYHADHHRYLGHDTMDVDIPTVIESYLFRHPITKMLWLICHPLIHGIRPFCKSPKPITGWEIVNTFCQLAFDVCFYRVMGLKAFVYLLAGTLFGLGFHPLSGHFISEHYLFTKGQATMSYYGPLNFVLFNVGYHVEHHDFPYVPYSRLPDVKRLAPEYYDHLPYHTSWIKVLWDFIFDSEMGPHARGVGYLKDNNSNKDK